MRIAHLSDLHFGAADDLVVTALERDIERAAPDVVVITGDLTQSGSRHEFDEAARFLGRLPAPPVVVPGNHDVPSRSLLTRAFRPYERFRACVGHDIDPQRVIGTTAFAGINSARRARLGWDWSQGSVSRSQLEDALRFLRETKTPYRCLALHHPLIGVGSRQNNRTARRAGRVLEAVLAGSVNLILCGHSHRPLVMELRAGDRNGNTSLVVQSSTATSHRRRGHTNGYTIIDLSRHSARVTPREWQAGREFTEVWSLDYGAPADADIRSAVEG
jgi:3',5'-cyclic AMP phosphodiesterase CpdA